MGLAPCKGFNKVTYKINEKLIIIEIMNEVFTKDSDIVEDIEIKITDIPDQLNLCGKHFHLQGAVAFKGKSKNIATIGHYVAVCKRLNNQCELFDDLLKKKSKHFQNHQKFYCQCLVYTV